MKPKPSEVKLVLGMLTNEEWADETECAEAIVAALYESWMSKRSRQPFALAVGHPGHSATLYGPYSTKVEAERAYRRGTGQTSERDTVAVFRMVTEDQADEAGAVSNSSSALATKDHAPSA